MFYFLGVIPLLQIAAAVHVVKTGRNWNWLWIIFFFPLLGTAVYFIAEVLPSLRLPRHAVANFTERALDFAQPERELKRLQERLEILDSVDNRRALARGYLRANLPEKAITLYQHCLQGVFQDDAEIMLELGQALFAAGQLEECQRLVAKLKQSHPSYEAPRRELLNARAYEGLGHETEALHIYERLVKNHGGEEARCRWAQLLEKTGHVEKAQVLYGDIIKRAQRQDRRYRALHREWIGLAQTGAQRLATIK